VNKELIKELMEQSKRSKQSGEAVANKMLKDDRFGRLFTDKEFQIDKQSEAYKLIKPQDKRAREKDDVDSISSG
jgi:hypothetical protein